MARMAGLISFDLNDYCEQGEIGVQMFCADCPDHRSEDAGMSVSLCPVRYGCGLNRGRCIECDGLFAPFLLMHDAAESLIGNYGIRPARLRQLPGSVEISNDPSNIVRLSDIPITYSFKQTCL